MSRWRLLLTARHRCGRGKRARQLAELLATNPQAVPELVTAVKLFTNAWMRTL
jgi:hypothetical protein